MTRSLAKLSGGNDRPYLCINLAAHTSLRISFLPSPALVSAFLLIDPISNMERATLKPNSLGFAVGEKCYGVLAHERHIPQIEHQWLSRRLDREQLLELFAVLLFYPATDSEHHLTVS